jgi:hypothetical protein
MKTRVYTEEQRHAVGYAVGLFVMGPDNFSDLFGYHFYREQEMDKT